MKAALIGLQSVFGSSRKPVYSTTVVSVTQMFVLVGGVAVAQEAEIIEPCSHAKSTLPRDSRRSCLSSRRCAPCAPEHVEHKTLSDLSHAEEK